MKKALITGITGQDGALLAEFLLEKGYEVHGIKRRSSLFNTQRVDHLYKSPFESDRRFFLHYGDLADGGSLGRLLREIQPDEIYNLGAMPHVKVSFEMPEYTADINAIGPLRILEEIRSWTGKNPKFYQASTSEMFGGSLLSPQTEQTPFYPKSPYGTAKLFAYWITINYREAYDLFAVNGILFNHESPLRGETFLTRKVTRSLASILHGEESTLYVGNLEAQRDWGHAKDYVRAMWMMLQAEVPKDYVIATGQTHTVRSFIIKAFEVAGITLDFRGEGKEEEGFVKVIHSNNLLKTELKIGQVLVKINERYFRPNEVEHLLGDATLAKQDLGWQPEISFDELVEEMVLFDYNEKAKK